ncbi:expressed conserved protein [Echinococcus multilocularis]|uniref:Expressed conserved protein n=1 Tax=Echinococcus multilocularis TaxID=6211 RepID=A0A068Y327_ECHMU|nr:expressed conserved protein [Echinococcus multilocularis]
MPFYGQAVVKHALTNMPSRAEVEAALKNKASDGKIKGEDVLASTCSLGVPTDAVDRYLKEHKDSEGMVDLAAVTKFISSL